MPDQQAGKKVRDQRQMKYQMLPHARPGGMAGLLELLLDKGGRDDIYRLADDLAFEIDDLLPIVDAAQLLGFLKVEEGDVPITESGAEFANSEILRQKELFRDAALANVLLLRQIRRALEAKSDHTVPEDFFLDMLDEQFSEEECVRQWRPRLRGAATQSCSTSTRRGGDSCCRMHRKRRLPPMRRGVSTHQHPLARTLVTARTWPFVLDVGVAFCGLAALLRHPSYGALLDGHARAGGARFRTRRAHCRCTRSTPWCASASRIC